MPGPVRRSCDHGYYDDCESPGCSGGIFVSTADVLASLPVESLKEELKQRGFVAVARTVTRIPYSDKVPDARRS